jgi:hypothetical protein
MLLAVRIIPDGRAASNQQALSFSGFTTPTVTYRQTSLHTYEGPLALLRTRMALVWRAVIELTGRLD